jgi:phosphopantothenoylcysteine decarboxylase/phosphopantothenate--cysteine ligase
VTIVSGPVEVVYPSGANVVPVVSTEEMLDACQRAFPDCDGMIGVAAPCDYRPRRIAAGKIAKTGEPLLLELVETPDVVATMGAVKRHQWLVGFALETDDHRLRALAKLEKKCCDLMVVNGPEAMNALDTSLEVIDRSGAVIDTLAGSKTEVAVRLWALVEQRLVNSKR